MALLHLIGIVVAPSHAGDANATQLVRCNRRHIEIEQRVLWQLSLQGTQGRAACNLSRQPAHGWRVGCAVFEIRRAHSDARHAHDDRFHGAGYGSAVGHVDAQVVSGVDACHHQIGHDA